MQRIFKRDLVIILLVAMLILLIIDYAFITMSLTESRKHLSSEKLNRIVSILEENEIELNALKNSLNEDYLIRAQALVYLIEKDESILGDLNELKKIAKLLNVDEVHISDEEGVIAYSSVPEYIGLDFHDGEQMQGFLPVLYEEQDYVIQEVQPNTAEGKMMQYVGVKRTKKQGIVQVGLEPKRLLEALKRNQYSYILSRMSTDLDEDIFVLDIASGTFVGHTDENVESGSHINNFDMEVTDLLACDDGKFLIFNDGMEYVVTRKYNDIILGISIGKEVLYESRTREMLSVAFYLLMLGIAVSIMLNRVLYKNVLQGIHHIIDDLKVIKKGNLEKVVEVGGNPELESLSDSINEMVQGILNTIMRFSKIIEITDIPMASFECRPDMKKVLVTSRLKELLQLEEGEERILKDKKLFFNKLEKIKENPVSDEDDIYCIGEDRFVKIIIAEEGDSVVGSIMDVSEDYIKKRTLQYEYRHDPLTKLKNYKAFRECVEEVLESEKEDSILAGVMIDLDDFKGINDTYGHDFGDQYLKEFSKILRKLPDEHSFYARRSGDEFCIFFYHYETKEEVVHLLEKLWKDIGQMIITTEGGQLLSFTASGGLAWVQQRTFKVIMRKADDILYHVKQVEKGTFKVEDMD